MATSDIRKYFHAHFVIKSREIIGILKTFEIIF